MTRDELLVADLAQLNEWIDDTIMKDRKHIAGDWPNWSGDISAAMEAEDKILQMDDATKVRYAEALTVILNIDTWNITTSAILLLVHANAEQRVKAALLAVLQEVTV